MARFIPKHRPRLPFRIPFFRIFYSTTYTILYIIVLLLLCVNPAAMIYTAFDHYAYQYTFEIGGTYILTALLALFIYFSRLYTNRTVMAAVGKSWIPVEDGEVAKKVRKMITRALERSAIIALESRPRDLSGHVSTVASNSTEITTEKDHFNPTVGRIVKVNPHNPPWGLIEHPGWSAPSRADTNVAPHIQFRTVIHELANLVEAKAVSLAPISPYAVPSQPDDPIKADPSIVTLLQRRPCSDLRTYLGHLSLLGLINPPSVGEAFLHQYDRARFSCLPLSEREFEHLMEAFALLLTGMQELSLTLVGEMQANTLATDAADISSLSSSSVSTSSRSTSIAGSVRMSRRAQTAETMPFLSPYVSNGSYGAAPSTAKNAAAKPQTPSPSRFGSPVTPRPQTANTHFSQSVASTMRREPSQETFGSVGSVLRTMPIMEDALSLSSGSSKDSLRSRSLRSYAGSVIRHSSGAGSSEPGHGWVPPG